MAVALAREELVTVVIDRKLCGSRDFGWGGGGGGGRDNLLERIDQEFGIDVVINYCVE